MRKGCFRILTMLLLLVLMMSGCKEAAPVIKYQIGRSVNGVYDDSRDSHVYLNGLEPRFINKDMEEPELYDMIFHGRIVALTELKDGAIQIKGLNPFYIDENGTIHREEPTDIFRGEQQTIEYHMDYRVVTIEVLECVKGDLQTGEQIQVAETWMDQYLHYFFPQEDDPTASTHVLRQVGSEEIFCIDLERVSDSYGEVCARRVFTWRLDGYPVLEGKALNAYRLLVESGEVLLDWETPPNGGKFQPMKRVPVGEFFDSLREKIVKREAELEAYRQMKLEPPQVTYTIEMGHRGRTDQPKVPIVSFDCSTSSDGLVDYLAERKNPDGSSRRIYNYGDPADAFVEPGKTYTYRIYTVGTEFWALSELPMSEYTEITITIPEVLSEKPQ